MKHAPVVMTNAVIEKMEAGGIGTGTDPSYKPAIEEWCPDVLDIREQFPINRSITTAIAVNHGIPHPCYLKISVLAPMTVDFLVTRVRNGERYLQAYNAKRDGDSE